MDGLTQELRKILKSIKTKSYVAHTDSIRSEASLLHVEGNGWSPNLFKVSTPSPHHADIEPSDERTPLLTSHLKASNKLS